MRSIWNRELTDKRMVQPYGIGIVIMRKGAHRTYSRASLSSKTRLDKILTLADNAGAGLYVFPDKVHLPPGKE
jgi:hypothetical protein